jgi:MFS family permease
VKRNALAGIFISMLCYLQFVMPRLGWRWLLALSSLPSALLLFFYRVTPESPRYLCLKGRTSDAISVLEKIARMNGTKLPSGVLVSDYQIELQEKSIPSEDTLLLSSGRTENSTPKQIDSNIAGISSLLVLLSPKLVRSTLLLWVVFFGNAFSYYGLVLLTSELNNGRTKCMQTKLQSQKSQDVNYRDVFIASFAGNLVFLYQYHLSWL